MYMDHTPVGIPQEEGMMSIATSFPHKETKVIEPLGLGPTPAHNTTKKLCLNVTVRLSIDGYELMNPKRKVMM